MVCPTQGRTVLGQSTKALRWPSHPRIPIMNRTFLSAITFILLLAPMTATTRAQEGGGRQEAYGLTMSGRRLSAEDAASLEKRIAENPDDIASRPKLLGYYFGKQFQD